MINPVLGQEALVPTYGLGRVTEIGPERCGEPSFIGVTPYVAGFQMNFAPGNVQLVRIVGRFD